MKILFIYSLDDVNPALKPLRSWSGAQLGISYISSVLKTDGHRTSLLVLGSNNYRQSVRQLETCLGDFKPELICLTAVYSQYRFMETIARHVKTHHPGIYLILGGVHATLQPEEALSGPFEAICVGEGEYPVLELCRQLESGQAPHGIANLWIKSDGGGEKNPTREFIQNLDLLPFPDRTMWEPWVAFRPDDEMVISAGRGCPYNCTYCSNHALRKTAKGSYVRMRSPESILAEVEFLYRNYPHRRIFFELETLDCYKTWTIELCSKLAQFNASVPVPLSFGSNYRINPHTIDENLFSELEKAHFRDINIGLESGSERIRREVLKRNYSNDDFLKVVSLARSHGLRIFVYNMIGLPEESDDDYKETVLLNRMIQPDGHFTGIYYPYPGTELYDLCLEKGFLRRAAPVLMERKQPAITLPNFSESGIKSAYTWFNYRVYRGHKPLWYLMEQTILIKIGSSMGGNRLLQKMILFVKSLQNNYRKIFSSQRLKSTR